MVLPLVKIICSYQKPSPLPLELILPSAKICLKVLLYCKATSSIQKWTSSEHSSPDLAVLQGACEALRSKFLAEPRLYQSPYLENELEVHVKYSLQSVSYSTVLILALMTWHFDASSSQASDGLITFLQKPCSDYLRLLLQDRYTGLMGETVPSHCNFLFFM